MNVVVDTSIWIDFFRGRAVPQLEDVLAEGRVVLPPIVVAELLSGARRPRDLKDLRGLLDDLPIHATPRSHWENVGLLRRRAASAGVSISTPDAHVAQCALDLSAPLMSRDAVFARVSSLSGLRLLGERAP